MSTTYEEIKALHASLPSFKPLFPITALKVAALLYLLSFFCLAFFFTTIPKHKVPIPELTVALGASLLAGFGIVALFCVLGVYV